MLRAWDVHEVPNNRDHLEPTCHGEEHTRYVFATNAGANPPTAGANPQKNRSKSTTELVQWTHRYTGSSKTEKLRETSIDDPQVITVNVETRVNIQTGTDEPKDLCGRNQCF